MTLTVQLLALRQHVLNIFGHNLVHLRQLFVQLTQVLLRAAVLIQLACLLDERVCGKKQVGT